MKYLSSLFFNLLIFILSLLLLFSVLEFFFRTTHFLGARISWSAPDTLLGWRFVPNRTFWYHEENDHSVIWKTNSSGWKDREWKKEKAPDTFRVAVLGDSYVEALQVEPERNFINLAEKKLAERGIKTEWMNFGRSGMSQAEELLVLQKDILPYKPDLVILFFYPVNDIDEISPQTAADPIRPYYFLQNDGLILDTSFNEKRSYKIKSLISPLKNNSAFISLFTQRFSLLQQQNRVKKLKASEKSGLHGYLSLATQNPEIVYQKNYALNKRLIKEIVKTARDNSVPSLLVSIDTPSYRPEVEASYKKTDPTFNSYFFDDDLKSLSAELNTPSLGLQQIFREYYQSTLKLLHWNYWTGTRGEYWEYGPHTGHWNYEGHEVVAEFIVEKIAALDLFSAKVSSALQKTGKSL